MACTARPHSNGTKSREPWRLPLTDDIRTWGKQAQEIADTERRRVAKERGKAFEKWTHEAWSTKPGTIFNWCEKELPAPIVATKNKTGEWLIQANQVVGEATER
eukprot:4222790-Heterocapsa_arctica.AAC.1